MLEDIIIIKFKLADKTPANLIEITELFIYYKRVAFSAHSYTSSSCLIRITESLYYFVKNLKDAADYKND